MGDAIAGVIPGAVPETPIRFAQALEVWHVLIANVASKADPTGPESPVASATGASHGRGSWHWRALWRWLCPGHKSTYERHLKPTTRLVLTIATLVLVMALCAAAVLASVTWTATVAGHEAALLERAEIVKDAIEVGGSACGVACCGVVLCCAVLCCVALRCVALCCVVLCCAVLCLCCVVQCCVVQCCVVQCCVVLCCAVQQRQQQQ